MKFFERMSDFFKSKNDSFIFPFTPKNNEICEKRRLFLKDFSISPDYHLAILSYIDENFGLRGKRVLEIGGSNIPREILIDDFGVKQYVGIDYIESWWPDPNHRREIVNSLNDLQKVFTQDQHYFIFSGNVNDLPDDFLANYFDIIVSFSSIEHFENVSLMLEKSYNVLKNGGLYFSSSEPIWSSGKGHHFWINENYNFQVTNDFDFIHLLYSKDQFLEKFKQKKEIEKVAHQIYSWNGINRFFYKEIEEAVFSSSFSEKDIHPFIIKYPPTDILNKLLNKYKDKIKNEKDFSIRGIQWILKK
jgi:SAM-dependent methyltransferase